MNKIKNRKELPNRRGKMGQAQDVYKPKDRVTRFLKEYIMNPFTITSASVLALGFLALLSHRIIRAAFRQSILVEQREIIYRRRP